MIFGNVKFEGKVVLAPLAGVTDSAFRLLCRRMGAAAVFTEMVSVDGLVKRSNKTMEYLKFREAERPIGFQLFGSRAEIFAQAVEKVQPLLPDLIDLNFGCPVKKVVQRGAGAALLKDLKKMQAIAEVVVRKASVPVFAKIRKGWDNETANTVEIAKRLEQCGVQAITIHPRTQAQQFKGSADWSTIASVKQAVSVPVIGSGDVRSVEDVKKMFDETGCDLVMIGRSSLGNPWLFEQTNYFLSTGKILTAPSLTTRLNIILEHFEDKIELSGERSALTEMRKHFSWYLKGLPGAARIRAELFSLNEVDAVKERLVLFFKNLENNENQNL